MPAPDRRLRSALAAGLAAVAAVFALEFLVAQAWLAGATATGGDQAVRTSLPFFPGSTITYLEPLGGAAYGSGWQPGWLCLAVGLAVTLLVARPWERLRAVSGP